MNSARGLEELRRAAIPLACDRPAYLDELRQAIDLVLPTSNRRGWPGCRPLPRSICTYIEQRARTNSYPSTFDDSLVSACARGGPPYARLPSPHWLDLNHLAEILATIEPPETTIRQLIERLDGCSGATAGRIAAPFGKGRDARRSMREAVRQAEDAPQLAEVSVGPEIKAPEFEAVFDSNDDFIAATVKLRNIKALFAEDDDDEGAP